MSNDNHPTDTRPDGGDSTGWIVLGVVLVAVGVLLGAQQLGIVPWPLTRAWDFVMRARSGVGILLVGILLIVWSQSGRRFSAPARGAKLYRSRDDKWLAGVLGGLAHYLNLDATLLRLGFIGLVVLFDVGALIVIYIVMAIVVPVEPEPGATVVTPAAPQPVAPAAPVAAAEPAPPIAAEGGAAESQTSADDPTTRA